MLNVVDNWMGAVFRSKSDWFSGRQSLLPPHCMWVGFISPRLVCIITLSKTEMLIIIIIIIVVILTTETSQ